MAIHPLTEEQQTLLDEYRASGLSVSEFAKSKNISRGQIDYAIEKDRRLRSEEIIKYYGKGSFVPVPINNETSSKNTLDNSNNLISFLVNNVPISIDRENLKAFLEALK